MNNYMKIIHVKEVRKTLNKISNITLDYQKGILLINDEQITILVKVKIKEPDGWDVTKLFNHESAKQGTACPELVVDARGILAYLHKEELKDIIREVVKEVIPAEQASTAGTNC